MEVYPSRRSWQSGRLDARAGPGQLLFGRMYEDAGVELRVFPPGGRIFCIASAGCTALALGHHYDVVAVDINPAQIEYVRRRLAGDAPRLGRVDRGMALLRECAPVVGWRARALRDFLDLDDPAEQVTYWRKHLDTARFRAALDVVLSRAVMQTVYAQPFLRVLPPRFGRVIRARLRRGVARHSNRANPYARALLAGEAVTQPVPPAPSRIQLEHADAVEFLEREPPGSFEGFTLSNILDGASEGYAARLRDAVRRAAKPGAVAILRSFAEARGPAGAERAAEDRSMIWGSIESWRS